MAKRSRDTMTGSTSENGGEAGASGSLVPFKTLVNVGGRELTVGGAQGEATIQADELPALEHAIKLFKVALKGQARARRAKAKSKGARRGSKRGVRKAARRSAKPRAAKASASKRAEATEEIRPRRKSSASDE